MNIYKILTSKLINHSELARRIYPNVASPVQRLYNKLNCIKGQRITEKDEKLIKEVINELFI